MTICKFCEELLKFATDGNLEDGVFVIKISECSFCSIFRGMNHMPPWWRPPPHRKGRRMYARVVYSSEEVKPK